MLTFYGSGVCFLACQCQRWPQANILSVCQATSTDQLFDFDKLSSVHPTMYSGHRFWSQQANQPSTQSSSRSIHPSKHLTIFYLVSRSINQSTNAYLQDGAHVSNTRGALSTGPHACGRANGNRWSPTGDSGGGMHGCKGDEGDRSGDEGPAFSLHSQEGDTEAALVVCSTNQPPA